jgi:antitoxin component YwqK of YwqJK toxin-antitoxin module
MNRSKFKYCLILYVKLILLLLLLIFGLLSCSEIKHEVHKYPNGIVSYEGYFKNKQLVGIYRSYFSTGKLKTDEKYQYWPNHYRSKLVSGSYYDTSGKLISKVIAGKGKAITMTEKNSIYTDADYVDGILKKNTIYFYNGNVKQDQLYFDSDEFNKTIDYYYSGKIRQCRDNSSTAKRELTCYDEKGDTIDCDEMEYGIPERGIRIGVQLWIIEFDIKSSMPITILTKSTSELNEYYDLNHLFENHKFTLWGPDGRIIEPTGKGKREFDKFNKSTDSKDLQRYDSQYGYYVNNVKPHLSELYNIKITGEYILNLSYFHKFDDGQIVEIKAKPFKFEVVDMFGKAW